MRIAIGCRPRWVPIEGGPDGVPAGAGPRGARRRDGLQRRWITRPSAPPRPAPSWPATPTGRSCSAGRARGSRSPRTRCTGSAPRCATTCTWRACRAQHNDANVLAMGGARGRARLREEIVGCGWRRRSRADGTRRGSSRSRRSNERRWTMREIRSVIWDALKATDPEVADAIAGELNRERTNLRLIASENYASPAVLAAVGSTMNNKYAEGYPGPPLLRRLRVRRRHRAARDRPRQGAVRCRARQRAAARRRAGEHGGVRRVPHSRGREREGARDGARPWRPPDPRFAGQRVGHVVQLRGLRGRPRDRAARHGPRARPRHGAPAEDHPVRVHRVPARDRLQGVPRRSPTRSARCCGSTRRTSSGWSPAARTRRRCPTPTSSRSRRTRPCGARAARSILCKEEHAKAIDKAVFPMMQGGPLEHCIAGKAVCAEGGDGVRGLQGLRDPGRA